jgi:hypothetical protein
MWYRFAQSDVETKEEPIDLHPKEKEALEFYGLTNDAQKAGYILSNGKFLDYSEGGYERSLDHRNIENVMDEPENSKGDRYRDYVMPFMNLTGAIRVSYIIPYGYGKKSKHGEWSVDISFPPTTAQIQAIKNWHNDGSDFHYEVDPLGLDSSLLNAKKVTVENFLEGIRNRLLNVV